MTIPLQVQEHINYCDFFIIIIILLILPFYGDNLFLLDITFTGDTLFKHSRVEFVRFTKNILYILNTTI